jgi:excisionase family DNA binding protein
MFAYPAPLPPQAQHGDCNAWGQMRTDETSHLLSPREVAAELAISLPTVYRLISNGELPALRVGGQLRFDPAELRSSLRPVANEQEDH